MIVAAVTISSATAWILLQSARTNGDTVPGQRLPFVTPQSERAPASAETSVTSGPTPTTTDSQTVSVVPAAKRLTPTGKFRVRCGEKTCLLQSEVCCDTETGSACVQRGRDCGEWDHRYECDETADCPQDFKCCYGRRKAVCVKGACEDWQNQKCSDDSECPSGVCSMGVTCRKPGPGRLNLPSVPKANPEH